MSKRTRVVSRHGEYNFQTGMITATLLRRGVPMEQAFQLARELRRRLAGRERVTTGELGEELRALVRERLGELPEMPVTTPEALTVRVSGRRGAGSFSQGIFLRQMYNIGLSSEQAQQVLRELSSWLAKRSRPEIQRERLDKQVLRLLTRFFGAACARRYRLVRWLTEVERPVVVFIAGATGTGKSTLAMELGVRLGIPMVTSTDMIRETMRAVLTPELVPGLHDHSFGGIQQGGGVLSDPRERVLAGFRQQAQQVSVGIRAVIRRALREGVSIIVEGTHLLPPYDQYVPPGVEVYTAGLTLAVQDPAEHLARFPERDRGQRPAQPYLDSFQSVRWIHDDLLSLAEDNEEVVVIARGDADVTAAEALSFLSQALPVDDIPPEDPDEIEIESRRLYLILDGLGDEPIDGLEDRTPLQAAHTPVLDTLASSGAQGLVAVDWGGTHPNTADAMALLLGMDVGVGQLGRGLLEAMGSGVSIPRPSVVFRGNLATVEPGGVIVDRRAGRIREVHALLGGLQRVALKGGIFGSIVPGHEHRVTVVLHGAGLNAEVTDTDPGNQAPEWRVARAAPRDDSPEAARTARALNELLEVAALRLANHPVNQSRASSGQPVANAVLTRGAAHTDELGDVPSPRYDAAVVSGCRTVLGAARLCGMHVVTDARMTGSVDTDLDAKFAAVETLLGSWETVVLHLKGADVAAHDRMPELKRDYIARVDAALGRFLERVSRLDRRLSVLVTADHGTSSSTGVHLYEPAPVLLAQWAGPGRVGASFDERSAGQGALGSVAPGELLELLNEL